MNPSSEAPDEHYDEAYERGRIDGAARERAAIADMLRRRIPRDRREDVRVELAALAYIVSRRGAK